MQLVATWSEADVEGVRALLATYGSSSYQARVRELNLGTAWAAPSADAMWDVYVACMLTTGTRSGQSGPVAALYADAAAGCGALGLSAVSNMTNRRADVEAILRDAGIRYPARKASFVENTYENFVDDGRVTILDWCAPKLMLGRVDPLQATPQARLALEREAANSMSWGSNKIAGIGPKQARHILKQIGLGRETMVLDSRLMNYLWSRGEPSTSLPWVAVLGDRPGFEMVEGWFIELARLAGITPVELDTLLWEAGGESLEDEDPPQE